VPAATPTPSFDAEAYFGGKTMTFIVGSNPGGGFDFFGRLAARYLPNHIPGNPKMVVQNRPGGGGIGATNYLYNDVEPDGMKILSVNSGNFVSQIVGGEGIRYDLRDFGWLGVISGSTDDCYVRTDVGIANFEELQNSPEPIVFGALATTRWQPDLLRDELSANILTVAGYGSSTEIWLAMERGEVDGTCFGWNATNASNPTWGPDEFITHLIVYTAQDTYDVLPGIPTAAAYRDQMSEIGWQTLAAATLPDTLLRGVMVAPGTSDEIIEVLRDALWATLTDPGFLADAARAERDVAPIKGEDLPALVAKALDVGPGVAQALIDLGLTE